MGISLPHSAWDYVDVGAISKEKTLEKIVNYKGGSKIS